MLKLADKKLSVYKGGYKPIEILKNGQKISSFKTVGTEGKETVFEGTYDTPITIYGKSGYLPGKNLCPPPNNKNGSCFEGEVEFNWEVSAKENGRFDVSGAMITGIGVTTVLLNPGTYTASGCECIKLWWEENGNFLSLPVTFTLEKQTSVVGVMWYTSTTNIFLENQYIQIEKGETATEYSPYIGLPPLPKNYLPLISASGAVRCEGANVLPPKAAKFNEWDLVVNSSTSGAREFVLDLSPGEYLLSFDVLPDPPGGSYGYLYMMQSNDNWLTTQTDYNLIQRMNVNNNYRFTVKEGYSYKLWTWSMETKIDMFSNWQLRKMDIPSGRYLYSPTVTKQIDELMGLEVSEADEYNYIEENEGEKHFYISDVISGKLLKKRIGKMLIKGDEQFNQLSIESDDFNCYYCDVSNYITKSRNAQKVLCNYFGCLEALGFTKSGIVMGQNDTNLYFIVKKSSFADVNSFTDWLVVQNEKDNPVLIYYILDFEQVQEDTTELRSRPIYTRLIISEKENYPSLGLSNCIKVQNNSQ